MPIFKPGFLGHKQYTGKYQRGFADLIHMWTNGHCLNSIGKNIGDHYTDHPYCPNCLDKRAQEETEDPLHFFVECGAYGGQRGRLLSALEAIQPGFRATYADSNGTDKLRALMTDAPEGIFRSHGGK